MVYTEHPRGGQKGRGDGGGGDCECIVPSPPSPSQVYLLCMQCIGLSLNDRVFV